VKVGKSVTETFEMLKIALGEEAMCRTQTYEWWKRFKEGRTSVDDDPRSGRPPTSKTDDNDGKCDFISSGILGTDVSIQRVCPIQIRKSLPIFQFIILTFISSTVFGRFPAHNWELNDCSGSLWFYLRIVVTVVLCS
jgi:hypothetical protein